VSQLAKLVEFLGRDDVTEVVLATGRPVSVKSGGQFRPISRANLSLEQLEGLVAGSPLAPLLAHLRGGAVTLEGQPVTVDVQAMGDERVVRLTRGARGKAKTHAPAKGDSQRGGRVKRPTKASIAVPHVAAPPAPAAPATPPPERSRMRVSQGDPAFVTLVRSARDQRATDLHVAADRPAMARILGTLVPQGPTLGAAAVERMLAPLLDGDQRRALEDRGYVDSALDVTGAGRLRANIARVRGGWKGSFRLIAMAPPTLDQLGLPKELARITTYHQGLVVIAGPNGHGKTTTLAALVDLINSSKAHHILTIEDPVEIVHPRKKSVVSQREVGNHTRSFAAALKASLREDPDVIVIGELRDRETVEIALTAAETGHLVMATMSTPSAAKTLDRLIDMFPADEQQQVRSSLAAALKFVLSQRLLPSADGQGVVAAVELLTGVLPLAALIRDNKLFQVASLQQRGRAFGMIRMDDSLAELVRSGRVLEESAMRASESKRELANLLHPGAAAAASAAAAAAANPAGKGIAGLQSRLGGLFKKGEG